MQILQRAAPTQRVEPGKPEKREFEYIRLGTRTMITSFVVPTGEVVWDLGQTRTNLDFRAHVLRVAKHFPAMQKFDWVVDNLNTHCSLDLCEVMAYLNGVAFKPAALPTQVERRAFLSDPDHRHVFHYVPRHGSWLNQVELWFSVLSRQFLRRGEFASVQDFIARLTRYLDEYNLEKAHPYRWTYTGEPMVRGTPFETTRREQKRDDRFVNHFPADGAIDKMGGFCQYRASQGPSTLVQGGTRCRIHSPLRWKFPSNNANNSKRCYGLRQRRKPWCFAVALCCDVDMRAIRPTCKWATSSVAIDTPSRNIARAFSRTRFTRPARRTALWSAAVFFPRRHVWRSRALPQSHRGA